MTREEQLNSRPVVPLPVSAGTLNVRRMDGPTRLAFDEAVTARAVNSVASGAVLMAAAYAGSVVNEDGSPMWAFTDIESISVGIPGHWQSAVWDWACVESGLLKVGKDAAIKNS